MMGMFDTIMLHPKVVEVWDIRDPKSGELDFDVEFQTKSLDCCMSLYYIMPDDNGDIRLYSIDEPDEKYWVEYTDAEIEENNKKVPDNTAWSNILKIKKGDGHFTDEGFKIENRRKRSMGEHPHQWIRMYASEEYNVKFTDGIAVLCEQRKEE